MYVCKKRKKNFRALFDKKKIVRFLYLYKCKGIKKNRYIKDNINMGNFNFGRNWVGSVYPNNEGNDRIANLKKLNLASSQNRKQQNAVMVDPVLSWVFIRQQAGIPCSCQKVVDLSTKEEKNSNDPFVISLQEEIDDVYKNVVDSSNLQDYNGQYENEGLLDEIGDEVSLISGNDKGFCAICGNTGWTEGYRLHNGSRILGIEKNIYNMYKVEKNLDTRPISLKGTKGSYIEWKVRIPSGIKKILHLGLHNNKNLVNCQMFINGVEFSKDLKNFEGQEVVIKVLPEGNSWQVTHLDIWVSFADTFIDFPPVQRDSDFQFFEALQTIHFETIGSIPYVDRETLISEEKYGDLWKVTNATAQMTAERQLIKTECDARLVQTNELLSYMNFITQPTKVFSYQGLERIQGFYSFQLEKNLVRKR